MKRQKWYAVRYRHDEADSWKWTCRGAERSRPDGFSARGIVLFKTRRQGELDIARSQRQAGAVFQEVREWKGTVQK
jgi:hypothetical protein